MRLINIFIIFLCLFFLTVAQAETTIVSPSQSPSTLTTAQKFKDLTGIDLSGYLDVSYNYLRRSNDFISDQHDRELDLESNGFTLQQATVTLAKQPPQGFGGALTILIGRDAYTLNSFGWNPNVFGMQTVGLDSPQAFLQYSKGSFTIMGGKLQALAGAEDYDYTRATNFSRSILDFEATPGAVTGFRGTYVPNDKLSLSAGINNGWDTIEDTGRRKTIELSANFTPNDAYSFTVDGYSGGQRATDGSTTGPEGIRNLIDLVVTFKATEKLNFTAAYDYGEQSKASLPNNILGQAVWQGIAGYINYKFNEQWQTSFRGEVFDDADGYRTGVRQNWRELTFTVGYSPIKNIQFRAETRHDFFNANSVLNKNGITTANNNQSFALEMLYILT